MAVVSRTGKDESLNASRWSGFTRVGGTTKKNLSSKGKVWKGVRLPLVGGHQLWVTRPKTNPFLQGKVWEEYASRWSEVTIVGDTIKNQTLSSKGNVWKGVRLPLVGDDHRGWHDQVCA